MSKPPMPDPLHPGEFGALSRRVEEIERENRAMRWYMRWMVVRVQPIDLDRDDMDKFEKIKNAAWGLSF